MADNTNPGPAADKAVRSGAPAQGTRRRRVVRHLKLASLLLLLLALALPALYVWLALGYSYSSGERAGYVQKFSRKGWINKTWEGELAMVSMPGTNPEKFYFTVWDDSVAAHINATLGRRVALTYEQHTGIPSNFFGDTEYFVVNVKTIE